MQETLIQKTSIPPRIYGLPMIHERDVPLHPIISDIQAPTYKLAKYLAKKLHPLVGKCKHHVKNSAQFIITLQAITIAPTEILVSFYVESLFTKVPLKTTIAILNEHFTPQEVQLFEHTLTSTYFLYNKRFFKQTNGVTVGFPLSSAIANLYMENFEHMALETAEHKPSHFYRYVDDIFVIWPHGCERLQEFLHHLNGLHPNIKFTMKEEENGVLSFLDLQIMKKPNGVLEHGIYRKPTHMGPLLKWKHHPAQKHSILNTLFRRAMTIADQEHRRTEIAHLFNTLQKNGYKQQEISSVYRHTKNSAPTPQYHRVQSEEVQSVFIPCCGSLSIRIGRVLMRHNLSPVFLPPPRVKQMLRSAMDNLGLKTAGIYQISCECGKVYIGQTGRTIEERLKEHQRYLQYQYTYKSAVVEHSIKEKHKIMFEHVSVLYKGGNVQDRLLKEAIEIRLNDNSFNRDSGFSLSGCWSPIIQHLKMVGKARECAINLNPPSMLCWFSGVH